MSSAGTIYPKLILASNSPRRKELLALGGWEFEIVPADVDETPWPAEDPRSYAIRMSENKAKTAAARTGPEALVLAADTIVVRTDPESGKTEILGKPVDPAEARHMLVLLRGRIHQVMTSVSLMQRSTGLLETEVCVTDVPMRAYTDEEIEAYIASGDPMDKAGAYAIQHKGFHPVDELDGCYSNVIGLPICHAARLLSAHGYPPPADLVRACQDTQEIECPIFQQVVQGSN